MTGQAAASAAAALRVIIADGKFHGVTEAAIPTGARRTPASAPGRRRKLPFPINGQKAYTRTPPASDLPYGFVFALPFPPFGGHMPG